MRKYKDIGVHIIDDSRRLSNIASIYFTIYTSSTERMQQKKRTHIFNPNNGSKDNKKWLKNNEWQVICVKLRNDRIFQIIEIRKMTKRPKLAELDRITELPKFSKTSNILP